MDKKDIIQLLQKQKVEVLRDIANDFVSDEEKENISKWNKATLVAKIMSFEIGEEELNLIKDKCVIEEDNENVVTIKQAENNSEKKLKNQIADMRKKALENVIVTITCLDNKDISLNKDCETFSVENSYFSIAKVIPFNVPVEIPRCLAEAIKDIKISKVITLSDEQQRLQKRLSSVVRVPRYNVALVDKDTLG